MVNTLQLREFLEKAPTLPLLDVRAPLEFDHGHIPGAISFPLFTDEERKQVGTTYKQVSQDKAILLGLDFFGPKMSELVREAGRLAPQKEVLLHCWRGGMRSQSVAWLLNLAGFKVNLLQFGYKDYRRFALQQLQETYQFRVLGGLTGSGKTEILRELQNRGEQIIDLEYLARHKGSAFGGIGQEPQPTIEQFENDLAQALHQLDRTRPIWIEDENICIGKVNLPKPFFNQMQASPLVKLEVSREARVQKLAREYESVPAAALENAIDRIKKRLGGLATKEAMEAIAIGDLEKMVDIALAYYDKAYGYQLAGKEPALAFTVPLPGTNAEENAGLILQALQNRPTPAPL